MDHLELASLMTKQWMVWTEAGVEIFPVGGGDRIAFLVGSDAKEQADRIVQAHNASLSTAVEPTTNPKRYTMEVLLPDYRVEPEETSDGEWVRYEDIKHLPQDEPTRERHRGDTVHPKLAQQAWYHIGNFAITNPNETVERAVQWAYAQCRPVCPEEELEELAAARRGSAAIDSASAVAPSGVTAAPTTEPSADSIAVPSPSAICGCVGCNVRTEHFHYVVEASKEPGADVPIKRCCCGEKEWPPDAIQIEDARGVLHFAERPCHHK